MARLEEELKHAEKNKAPKMRVFLFLLFLFSAAAGIVIGAIYWALSELPQVKALETYKPIESSCVYSSEGELLAELYLERRTFIPHYRIPEHVKKAFISIEDIRFYKHPGVDFVGIVRALYYDLKAGSLVQGGSTITQQLAKMLFLKPDRSIKRKIREAVISIQIEKRYTKDEILGLYLNQAYFGTRAYGLEAASQTYFRKAASELNIAEAALLASLPKAPSLYSPFKNPEKAMERRRKVLREMLKNKFITEAQFNEADGFPLPLTPNFRKYNAPYFVEAMRQELENKYGNELYTEGYKIYTTLNLDMQNAAEEAVRKGLSSVEKRAGAGIEAALLALEIKTGQVKAMVGGSDFWKNQFNRSLHALRQPGSAFKPFVYAAAVEKGMTPEDGVEDAPIFLKGSKPGELWSPRNYDGKYHGTVTLKTAIALSLNAATVRLADKIGIKNVIEMARRLGIKSELQPYASLAIGASDVTLLEMVSAYSAFASGKRSKPVLYEKITGRDGRVIEIEEVKQPAEDLLSEKTVEEMKLLLRAVVEEGTAQSAKGLKRPVCGKTGTTNNYTDAWFIGFDDGLAVGVWVGRDNHKPIGKKEAGSKAALPIWIDFMKRAPLQNLQEQNP